MGQVAQTLGIPAELDFEGKTYKLAPFTFELQAKFETWLEKRAFQKCRQHFGDDPDELARQMDATRRDVAAGVYSFGGPASVLAMRSVPGMKRLVYLQLSVNHPDVDEAFMDRLIDARAAEVMAAANPHPPEDGAPKDPGSRAGA